MHQSNSPRKATHQQSNDTAQAAPLTAVTKRLKNFLSPAPHYTIGYPSTVYQMREERVGREKTDALHRLVHHFRAEHGFVEGATHAEKAHYPRVVRAFNRVEPPPGEKAAVDYLSSPKGYLAVRQAGRMRATPQTLTPEEVSSLCEEIRAALIWASRPFQERWEV